MSIQLLTLNIEGDRHLDRVAAAIARHLPDVVCLQEVIEANCARLAAAGGYDVKFFLSLHLPNRSGAQRNWGVAVMSRRPLRSQSEHYYSDDRHIRVAREPNDPRRILVMTELEHEGRTYRIATTHFTWSADGHIEEQQIADFARLRPVLAAYPDYVLCGDFNAPRGREMFDKFVDELGVVDHLPASVTTTLDPNLHRAGALQLVVDTIFSTPQYRVTDVRVLDGISDHKGILARIERP